MSDHDDSTAGETQPNRTGPFVVMAGIVVAIVVAVAAFLVAQRDDGAETESTSAPTETADAATADAATDDTAPARTPTGDTGDTATTVDVIELTISRGGEARERPQRFYARLAESLSSGDLDFALSRLDPAMDDLYGFDRCAASFERLVDPTFEIEFDRIVRTEPWLFESPVGTVDIDETTVTRIALSGNQQDGTFDESHLTIVDGRYHWFTYC